MIQIAGTSLHAEELYQQMSLGKLERLIVQQMGESQAVYSYESLQDLQFELQVRREIVESAKELEKSGARFAEFEHTRGNPEYWEVTEVGGLRLKPGISPSAAIRDIYRNGNKYGFECAMAMTIVLYKALLDVLGEEIFNRLFSGLYLFSWYHDHDLYLSTENRADYLPGDIMYFKNPEVNPETPEWQGENVVVVEGNRYFGHGIGVTSANRIIYFLNKHRKPGATQSAYLMDNATRPDFKQLSKYAFMQVADIAIREKTSKVPDFLYKLTPSVSFKDYLDHKELPEKYSITIHMGNKTFKV